MKSKEYNFVYCFDNNYKIQAFTSMISLLDTVDKKISIFVLFNEENLLNEIPRVILNHNNLKEIKVFKVNTIGYKFPNLTNVHITEATYYRLFFDKYLPEDLEFIIYIDADMICLNNPLSEINSVFSELKKLNKILGAAKHYEDKFKTELSVDEKDTLKIFDRLEISDSYFNAGFLIVNLNKWKKESTHKKLIDTMQNNFSKIVFWDQDVLNLLLNRQYLQINKNFNFKSSEISINNMNDDILFLHFMGSKKPWTLKKNLDYSYELYHRNFRKLGFDENYHLITSWRKDSFKVLIYLILSLRIFQLDFPIKYFISALKLIKKVN